MSFHDIAGDRLSQEKFRFFAFLALRSLGLSTKTEWSPLWTVYAGTSASKVLVDRAYVDHAYNFTTLLFETPSGVRENKERLIDTGDIQSFGRGLCR